MKNSIKKLFVMLAIVMSFVAVQNVCAATVEGTIEKILFRPPTITVGGTVILGMRLDYLCNQYTICLEVGDFVSVDYDEVLCKNGTIKNKATSITVDDVTVELR